MVSALRRYAAACHGRVYACALQVIQFTMQGVPGHSAVSAKVEYKSLSRSKVFQKIQLAGAQQTKPAERRKVP